MRIIFKICTRRLTQRGLCFSCSHIPDPTLIFYSFYSKKMSVCKIFTFHIIFLILWISLEIDNFPMSSILLIFGSGPYPIIHVCLSELAQLCCKPELVSFWVCLNARPNFVIVGDLFWPSIFLDTTSNHTSTRLLLFINFPKPGFISLVKY